MPRGSKPGERRGGRAKGVQNKFNADLKLTILEAFENAGGSKYLEGVAKTNPQVFCALLAKVLPHQLQHSGAVGSYVAQPIPTEQRDSDSLESAEGASADSSEDGYS